MKAERLPPVAIDTFRHYWELLRDGETGVLSRSEIEPAESLPDSETLGSWAGRGAEALGKTSVTIRARANEEGHLFGSVGESEIVEVLKEEKFDVDPRMVVLEKHIKELGVLDVEIRLDPAVSTRIKV